MVWNWPKKVAMEAPPVIDKKVFRDYVQSLRKGTQYTPDVPSLERKVYQFLFVPDETMSVHFDHDRLGSRARKVYDVQTVDKFALWKKKLGPQTSAIPVRVAHRGAPLRSIRGELFLVRSQQLFHLDSHRLNGVQFKRERLKMVLPYTQTHLRFGEFGYFLEEEAMIDNTINAWMYVGVTDYWDPLLDGGYSYSPVRRFTPHNKKLSEYYFFTLDEYDKHT